MTIIPYHRSLAPPDPVLVSGRGGQALYILDSFPENRDESNGNNIVKLWLQFIPIFGAMDSQLCKGHTTKKDIPMFLICIASTQKGIIKKTSPCS
jgi:hypothetical protein